MLEGALVVGALLGPATIGGPPGLVKVTNATALAVTLGRAFGRVRGLGAAARLELPLDFELLLLSLLGDLPGLPFLLSLPSGHLLA